MATILCQASDMLYQAATPHWPALAKKPLHCRVGSGLATYFRPGPARDTIVYGRKMVASKLAAENEWLSCREIRRFAYFGSSQALDHLLAHTVCHEFAHLVQSRLYRRVRGSVHNRAFYTILSQLHELAYADRVHRFVVAAAARQGLAFDIAAAPAPLLPNLRPGQLINFKHGGRWAEAKVLRLNRKTVSAVPVDEKTPVKYWRIPYGLIKP